MSQVQTFEAGGQAVTDYYEYGKRHAHGKKITLPGVFFEKIAGSRSIFGKIPSGEYPLKIAE